MSITAWIITGLFIAFMVFVTIGGFYINHERKQYEKHIADLKKEGAENAQNAANAVTEADKIKENANTGNHTDDMHTMAEQLHQYANSGK
jgi:cell division protein FtsL